MPSYAELRTEPPPGGTAWLAQITPGNMATYLLAPLRVKYGLGPQAIGAAGDNNHLYGRHRSRDWDLTSRYCPPEKRYYGTTDARDKRGAGNIYRAVDIGISGPPLWEACYRLDAAVRGGLLPGVAEWFGTFDGVHVVGWFEGHASSSDSSHLTHGHIGFWNEYADDQATMRATYATWTGEGGDEDMGAPWLSVAPSQTVYLIPGDLVGGKPVAIPLLDITKINSWRANGMRQVGSTIEPAAPYWFVTAVNAPWPPPEPPVEVEFTPEQLAEIGAAAQAGAEAGAPTHAELEQAAFEGAQRAEDS